MTDAVVYMRCSGDSQITGDTWERQEETIKKYTTANDIQIVATFADKGVTGKMELEGRHGLSQCIQYVQDQGVKLVMVESSDRLARDMIVAELIVRDFQKIGVRVVAASGGIDLTEGDDSNPTAKLIRQILAAIAEFERCMIVNKLRAARDRKRKLNGKCDGRKAFGEKPGEEEALGVIRKLAACYTAKTIAHALNSDGYQTRSGKPWRASVVSKIIAREFKKSAA